MNKFIKNLKIAYAQIEYQLRHIKWFTTNTGHKRLLFPCCSLAEGSPDLTMKVFDHLHQQDKEIGLWQDCCGMPLVYAHAKEAAIKAEQAILDTIKKQGITEIITPCTTCQKHFTTMFKDLEQPPQLTFLYDVLKTKAVTKLKTNYTVHHPCPARGNPELRDSFDQFAMNLSLTTQTQDHEHALACCLSHTPQSKTKISEHKDTDLVTYCAHCVQTFQHDLKIKHILELMFDEAYPINKTSFFSKLFKKRKLKKLVKQYFSK